MNLFPGLVSATSDLGLVDAIFKNVISHKAPVTKFILLGDPLGYDTIIQSYDMINGIILVPDYITLSYLINGDYPMFQKSYIDLLRRPPAEQFFATLLCVLNRNNNIIFYVPESCKDIGYAEFFLQYLQNTFGIQTCTRTTEYKYDERYNDSNITVMYMNDIISPEDFLYHFNGDLEYPVFMKLVNDIRPVVNNPNDANEYIKYFEYLQTTMRNAPNGSEMYMPVRVEQIKDVTINNAPGAKK